MYSFLCSILLFVFAAVNGCSNEPESDPKPYSFNGIDTLPYNLNQASSTVWFNATDELKEISGLSPTDQDDIFCAVQDEKGILFFVDINGGAIKNKVVFKEDGGDFEGVEMVGKTVYAVNSKGTIYAVSDWDKGKAKVEKYSTPLSKADDVEGLCFDAKRGALLLACKGNPDSANIRQIYAFDLKTNKLAEEPVFKINPEQIENLLEEKKNDGKVRYFAPSGIAIHPINGDVYVLSSVKKRLIVLDYATGNLKYAVQLSKKLLPQPEGISFDRFGNLFLSSEGKDGSSVLLQFKSNTGND